MAQKKRKKRARPPLDERHYLAIELLTTAPTKNLDDIARACMVNRRTLYRWRLRKDFERELRKVHERKMNERSRSLKGRFKLRSVADIEWFFNTIGVGTF
ncbi:MAG: hypothetical protein K6T85_09055 [Gorillibacterium sp.]|nr:hypothetical protein [Gorillibacterium sp.]